MHRARGRIEERKGAGIQQYVDAAVRFLPVYAGAHKARSIRVATTLMTCEVAAAALTELHAPAESESAYRYVNVCNPRCPLFFDHETDRWSCVPGLEHHPVWGVNWAGAVLICRHMGARLPLEREWECFASSNDPTRTYPWGDAAPTRSLANFGEHIGGTSRVGSFPASDIGLYDLAGNLSEWCQDPCEVPGDQGPSFERVAKGGAWSKDARHLEIRARRGKWERLGTTTIGFRPVWDD